LLKSSHLHVTDSLYENISQSSSITKSAAFDIERAYSTIIDELGEQRDQLLRRVHYVKQDIKR